jgi:LemA protein
MGLKAGVIAGAVVGGIVLLVLLITIIWTVSSYNSLVTMDEDVDGSWAQVENQYQRKVDLIPTLVETVDDYQEFEESTLTNITDLRTRWMDAGSSDEQLEVAGELDQALRSIILTYENYPYLQSVVVVHDLMVELEGTENRITVERMRYNDDVRDFNKEIKKFPKVIIANSFGFDERSYFESDAAPDNP